jgi:hypothetical protein
MNVLDRFTGKPVPDDEIFLLHPEPGYFSP